MKKVESFKTKEGVFLDSSLLLPKNLKGLVLFFPCGFGNAHAPFYQVPEELLLQKELGLFRYNPRSHGKSEGTWTVQSTVEDLVFCLTPYLQLLHSPVPLFGLAHSMGAASLLRIAEQVLNFEKILLAAPVLNSKESLLYKYENKTTDEFKQFYITGDSSKDLEFQEIMKTTHWMHKEVWDQNDFSKKLNYSVRNKYVNLGSLSEFLFSYFIEGIDTYQALEKIAERCTVYYPKKDDWFSPITVKQTCQTLGIDSHPLDDPSGHFLMHSWEFLWKKLIS